MNKVNYQKWLDGLIKYNVANEIVPTLLLHSCCAPCSSYVLEYLSKYFKITVLYYNPNIFPKEEYQYRIEEQARLINSLPTVHPIEFIATDYEPEHFYTITKGLENEPEGGKRCEECFRLRLTYAAQLAREMGFDYFTTTLSISPLKNSQLLNNLGNSISHEYGVKHLDADFKKKDGYKRSVELSKEYQLYRQDYCGCIYSKMEREKQIKESQNSSCNN